MSKYTLDEIIHLAQFIFDHLSDDPALLESEGAFKKSAPKAKIEDLFYHIIHHLTFPPSRFGPHEYLGALNYLITNEISFDQEKSDTTKNKQTNEEVMPSEVDFFTHYLEKLSQSNHIKDMINSYILYNYCHFAEEATLYAIKNKMSTTEIATALVELFQDKLKFISLTQSMFESLMVNKYFEESFEIKYPIQMTKICQQQLNYIQIEIQNLKAQIEKLNLEPDNKKTLPELQNELRFHQRRFKAIEKKLPVYDDVSYLTAPRPVSPHLILDEDEDELPPPKKKQKKKLKRKNE